MIRSKSEIVILEFVRSVKWKNVYDYEEVNKE